MSGKGTTTNNPSVEVLIKDSPCYLIRNCLNISEQISIYNDIISRSRDIDNTNSKQCMHPTPKTLIFNDNQSTLKFKGDDEDDNVYNQLIIHHANANLHEYAYQKKNNQLGDKETLTKMMMITSYVSSSSETSTTSPSSMSVAVIRYKPPNDNFPLHIDHTNDNSYVFLLSLGCSANFIVKGPTNIEKKEFRFRSGDVLVFDPSTNAGILHGVGSINANSFPTTNDDVLHADHEECIPKDFQQFRFGVQCRVKYG